MSLNKKINFYRPKQKKKKLNKNKETHSLTQYLVWKKRRVQCQWTKFSFLFAKRKFSGLRSPCITPLAWHAHFFLFFFFHFLGNQTCLWLEQCMKGHERSMVWIWLFSKKVSLIGNDLRWLGKWMLIVFSSTSFGLFCSSVVARLRFHCFYWYCRKLPINLEKPCHSG